MKQRQFKLGALWFPLFVALVAAVLWYWRDPIFAVFGSRERVKAFVEAAGAWGPVVFIGLQVVQVVIFVLPGEIVQIAGGYLFGVLEGSLLSVLGIAIGSMLDFMVARVLGRRFVVSLFGEAKLEKFAAINDSPRSEAAFFLLFVIPGLPKDALCFIAGLSPLKPGVFLAVSMIGRLPGIVGSALMGSAALEGRIALFAGVAIAAAVLFALGLWFRDSIHNSIVSLFHRHRGEPKKTRD